MIPQSSVALSSCRRMTSAVLSLSVRISERLLVPSTLRRVVEASSWVDTGASLTFTTDARGFWNGAQ